MTTQDDDIFARPYQSDPAEEAFYAARIAFVKAWREAHPDWLMSEVWICPLCRFACQVIEGGRAQVFIDAHIENHGPDWTAYLALAEAAAPARAMSSSTRSECSL